jgi:hypothetical protein
MNEYNDEPATDRKNLFGDKDKLIRRQKNAIGYNLYRVVDRAQKSYPFLCI